MVMAMVAKMRSMRCLVLAIRSCCRPGILEWQSEQQEGEEQFFHNRDDNSLFVYLSRTKLLAAEKSTNTIINRQSFEHANIGAARIARGDHADG